MNLCHMGFTSTYEPESKEVDYDGHILDVPAYARYVCIDRDGQVWALSDAPIWDAIRGTWNPEAVRAGRVVGTINKRFHGHDVGSSLQYVGDQIAGTRAEMDGN